MHGETVRAHVVVFASWWKREKKNGRVSRRGQSRIFTRRGGSSRTSPSLGAETLSTFFFVPRLKSATSTLCHVTRCSMPRLSAMGFTRAPAVPTGAAHVAPLSSRRPDPTQPWVRHPPRGRGDPRRPRRPEPTSRFTRRSPRCRDSTPTPRLTPSPRSRPRLHHARRRAPRPLEAFARARRAQAHARARVFRRGFPFPRRRSRSRFLRARLGRARRGGGGGGGDAFPLRRGPRVRGAERARGGSRGRV